MGGNFPFPVKYGYTTVGWVEAGPADLEGRVVFASSLFWCYCQVWSRSLYLMTLPTHLGQRK